MIDDVTAISCKACGSYLRPEIADGCPCNSARGVNHGLVPRDVCTCVICDPAQTGSSRVRVRSVTPFPPTSRTPVSSAPVAPRRFPDVGFPDEPSGGEVPAVLERQAAYASNAAPRKDDRGKRQWRLVPWEALGDVVDVLTWACTREDPPPYGAGSWRHVPNAIERSSDAAMRHLTECLAAQAEGRSMREVKDKQSGLPSLAHLACDVLFLIALDR